MAEEISKQSQSVEGVKILLKIYSQMQERNDLKTELFIKKKADLKHRENSQPIHIESNEEASSGGPRKVGTNVTRRRVLISHLKETRSYSQRWGNSPPKQKPGLVSQDHGRMTPRHFRDPRVSLSSQAQSIRACSSLSGAIPQRAQAVNMSGILCPPGPISTGKQKAGGMGALLPPPRF